jgi:hypothetical protein
MTLDADGHRSDILGSLREALAGPLAAGARTDMLAIDNMGNVTLESGLWEPMLLVAPVGDLDGSTIDVGATINNTPLPTVHFAPWSEARSFLPLFLPTTAIPAAGVKLTLTAKLDGVAIQTSELRNRLCIQVLSGRFGRLFYVLHAETPRIRRLLRTVARIRSLSGAEGAMLDRMGQELAVPRFSDRIATAGGVIITEEQREDDASYRSRLRIYRPFVMPTRGYVEGLLNAKGPLNPGDPPATPRFEIDEEDNPFSIALRLVSVAATEADAVKARHNYQAYLRDTVLIDATSATPPERKLPQTRRRQQDALRDRLKAFLKFAGPSSAMAPALANALDRAAVATAALNIALRLEVLRAQEDDGGSRWELGLAAEIVAPAQAELDALAQKARAIDLATIAEPRTRSLLTRLKATAPDAGGNAEWFFGAMGMRTVHPTAPGRLMLSHFSTRGLIVTGDGDFAAGGQPAPFGASLLAPNDEASNAALSFALSGGSAGWTGGQPPWSRVADAGIPAAIADLQLPAAAMGNRLRALGLPTDFAVDHFKQALTNYPTSVFALMRFSAAFSTSLAGGNQASWDRLALIVETLARSGVAAAALLRETGAPLTLVASAIGLPLMASNLTARRTAGFVWRTLPVTDGNYSISGAGTRAAFTGGPGIAAIAVVGYARQGLTDPFEYRVTASADTALSIAQYEHLMNLLRHVTPAGVQANTWEIRRSHVVTVPGTAPSPLPPSLTRAFRPFHRPRFTGADAPPLPPVS